MRLVSLLVAVNRPAISGATNQANANAMAPETTTLPTKRNQPGVGSGELSFTIVLGGSYGLSIVASSCWRANVLP